MSTTALTTFNPVNMTVALRKVAQAAQTAFSYLKMEKTGDWVHGAQQTSVPEDAEFLINPAAFDHGYVAWGDGEKFGEIIQGILDPLPELPPVPAGAKGWDFQLGIHLAGAGDGVQFVYRATSVGGKRVIAQIAAEVAERIEAGETKLVPVVTLTSESYKHSKYGKIFVPLMDIVRWVAMPALGETKKDALAKAKAAPVKAAPVKVAPGRPMPAKAPAKNLAAKATK